MSMKTPIPFILLTSQRTGSTWLVNLLNLSKDVEIKGEIFLNRSFEKTDASIKLNYKPDSIWNFKNEHPEKNPKSFVYNIALTPFFKPEPRALGFKLMYKQALENIYLYKLIKCNAKVIHLTRCNLLEQHISKLRNREFGIDHSFNQKADQADARLTIGICSMLIHFLKSYLTSSIFKLLLLVSRLPVHNVKYECLQRNPQKEVSEICEFLGVDPPESTTTNMLKVSPGFIADKIKNFDQVRFWLSALGMGRFVKSKDVCC